MRPSGEQKTAALAAGQALTHQPDPYLRLLAALETPGSPQLNYARDVAPWLGPHACIFLSSLGSSSSALLSLLEQGLLGTASAGAFPFSAAGAQGALVLDTSDESKARSFVDSQAAHARAHATSYRGVAYQLNAEGVAFGIVERLVVIGSESGMHGVIDTTLGGGSLAHASGYAKLLAAAPADALAHLYANPAAAGASQAKGSKEEGATEGLAGLLSLLAGTREANISLVAAASGAGSSTTTGSSASGPSVTLDADTLASGASGGLLAVDPQAASALAELPGESWLAIGLGHVGAKLTQDVQGLRTLGALFGSSSKARRPASVSASARSCRL